MDYAVLLALIVVLALSEASTPFERYIYNESDAVLAPLKLLLPAPYSLWDVSTITPASQRLQTAQCAGAVAIQLSPQHQEYCSVLVCAPYSHTGASQCLCAVLHHHAPQPLGAAQHHSRLLECGVRDSGRHKSCQARSKHTTSQRRYMQVALVAAHQRQHKHNALAVRAVHTACTRVD